MKEGAIYTSDEKVMIEAARGGLVELGADEDSISRFEDVPDAICVFYSSSDKKILFGRFSPGSRIDDAFLRGGTLAFSVFKGSEGLGAFLAFAKWLKYERETQVVVLNDIYKATVVSEGGKKVANVAGTKIPFEAVEALYHAMKSK